MAKKFNFRFEPMLKVRKHREKERQKEHAEAARKVLEQRARLGALDEERLKTVRQQRERLSGPISVAETLICSRYMVRLKAERVAGSEVLHGLETEAAKRREKLVEAARDRKVYELLKEKRQLLHLQELEKTEQKEIDDVATSGFRRKSQD